MPADKEFNTVVDQIRLLRSRGLQINNLQSAKNHLSEKNYFDLINGLESLLLDNPSSAVKTYTKKSFDNFLKLYDFDKQLSSIILKKISEFEIKLKTSIAYNFCKNHCSILTENNNYIDINSYSIPKTTEAPNEYIFYFKNHKLFKKDYSYNGRFRGIFNGKVFYNGDKTELKGTFSGRFGSTSIREVNGTCIFQNRRQPTLLSSLKTVATASGDEISVSIEINKNENIKGLNYIDDCKIKFPYIDKYNNPPFWVVIKTLMFTDIIVLMYGLKKRTFDDVLRDFKLKSNDKEKFINSLTIIRELRNSCAHFELISLFNTPQNLKINNRLISELSLKTRRSQYVIKLFDVLKVLKCFIDISEVYSFIRHYYISEMRFGNDEIMIALLERMGNPNIDDWI